MNLKNKNIIEKISIVSNTEESIYWLRMELLEKLLEDKIQITFYAPHGRHLEEFTKRNIDRVCNQISRHGKNIFSELSLFLFYLKSFSEVKPDVVLTYTIKPNIYAGLACRILKIPYICNITGVGVVFQKNNILQKVVSFILKLSLKDAMCVFFQNETNLNLYLKRKIINSNQVKLLPGSGVNLDIYRELLYPKEDKIIRFIMIGRKCKDKGICEFLNAVERIYEEFKNVEFYIVGWYEWDKYLQRIDRLSKLGVLIDHEYMTQPEIRELLEKIHVIVHPSYHEGMANVLLEASACARPALASRIPGCQEIIDNGETGMLFSPKDEEALYQAMKNFIQLPYSEKEEMGKKARIKIQKEFDRNIIIENYLKIISKVPLRK